MVSFLNSAGRGEVNFWNMLGGGVFELGICVCGGRDRFIIFL